MTCWRTLRHLPACAGCEGAEMPTLELDDIRQAAGHDCGEAAARVVFRYWGKRGKTPLSSPIDGTDPRTLESSLRAAKLTVQAGSMDVDDLRYHTRKGRPVICLVMEPEHVGHYVVVAGVERGWVAFQCPGSGPQRERVAAFDGRWNDVDRMGVNYVRWGIVVEG